MHLRWIPLLLPVLGSLSLSALSVEAPSWEPPPLSEVMVSLQGLEFNAFADQLADNYLLYRPELLTSYGLSAVLGLRDDRLGAYGFKEIEESLSWGTVGFDALSSFAPATFELRQHVTYEVLLQILATRETYAAAWPFFWNAVCPSLRSAFFGIERFFSDVHPSGSLENLDDLIVRYWQMDRVVEGWIEEIEAAMELGVFLPAGDISWLIHRILPDYASIDRISSHPYYVIANRKLSDVPNVSSSLKTDYRARFSEVIESVVAPAFDSLLTLLQRAEELAPEEGDWVAVDHWPSYYSMMLEGVLGSKLTAQAIHARAITEVERLTTEIRALVSEPGDDEKGIQQVIGVLHSRQYQCGTYTLHRELLEHATDFYEFAEARATRLFEQLPSESLAIRMETVPNPAYNPGGFDAREESAFLIPYATSFPRFSLADIVFHETIPGHHLQISAARSAPINRLQQLQLWRGYTEGWALYAQQLADEDRWYADDPCGRLGYLGNKLLVASLTAVETGLYALNWSHDQAQTYAQQNVPLDHATIDYFVRYSVHDPVQLTKYFAGWMTIIDQRERAQHVLGSRFDLPAFHTAILAYGCVPLRVLDMIVTDYIRQQVRDLITR